MKTILYNPSSLEVSFAEAIESLSQKIEEKVKPNSIEEIEKLIEEDNPRLIFKLKDNEGDLHEVVIQVIQRIDEI